MAVVSKEVRLKSKGETEMTNITGEVAGALSESKLSNGTVTVFCPGSTGVVSTVEYEPGLLKDIPRALEVFAPRHAHYEHHKTWGDDNGSGHVRATILGPSLTVPFIDGKLTLGTWQQIVFIDCDTRPRDRRLVLQFIGE
ncbi:MAG: secondary thiamine-phosphate synthase enzyme YjbQ [Candidatus Altiarchaeota archaeon]